MWYVYVYKYVYIYTYPHQKSNFNTVSNSDKSQLAKNFGTKLPPGSPGPLTHQKLGLGKKSQGFHCMKKFPALLKPWNTAWSMTIFPKLMGLWNIPYI